MLYDTSKIYGDIRAMLPVRTEIIQEGTFQGQEFKSLIDQYYYLGFDRSVGENLKYLVYSPQGKLLACLLFGSAAWSCAPRDQFIGWNALSRRNNLIYTTNNTRFLILPWVKVPHLASHIQAENERLTIENAEMRARLKQNSLNSSQPPSSSRFIKPKSLRVKTGRMPGGQPGHKGSALPVKEIPDEVAEHQADTCLHCGSDLYNETATLSRTRQVVDVKIVPVITQHAVYSKNCPLCGKTTTATFPAGVDHYIQYGDTFRSVIVCLNQGNYIPYDRLARISRDVLGVPVSQGTLVNIVHKCGRSLKDSQQSMISGSLITTIPIAASKAASDNLAIEGSLSTIKIEAWGIIVT